MNTRGFQGRWARPESKTIAAGAVPHRRVPLSWTFTLEDEDETQIASWNWEDFQKLGATEVTVDIHCVTRWSKFDTRWRGVTVDRVLEAAGIDEPPEPYVMAFCEGGYTTNLPVEDLIDGKAMIAWEYNGEPLEPEHGGAGPPPGAAPVPMEVRQVGARAALHGGQRARLLGEQRLSPPRRPPTGAAV
jgi:DMSO/TMAO reductase YedYZ molybdopterin-dependent catalytic subunit